MPFLLFLIAGLLGGTGGPLIWPALALLLGIIGSFTGEMVREWITAPNHAKHNLQLALAPSPSACAPPQSSAPHLMVSPTDIQSIGDEIAIRWSDGSENYYPMERLRAWSPSAETAGERDLLGQKIGGDDRTEFPGVRATAWQIVGGYAVAFAFSDGHKTGLYGYDYLKAIGKKLGQD